MMRQTNRADDLDYIIAIHSRRKRLVRFGLVLVCLLPWLMVISEAEAQSYFKRDQAFFINDGSCPSQVREVFRDAANMWSFYGPMKVLEILNETSKKGEKDDHSLIYCADQEWMDAEFGNGKTNSIAGSTQVWADDNFNIWETDIALSKDWVKPCVMLHEIGHSIGLANAWNGDESDNHPDDPLAVMYAFAESDRSRDGKQREGCNQSFLISTDLLLVAERYNKPANCTPYIQGDWSIYFPYIQGFEAEVVYRPNTGDWKVLWAAPSPEGDWDCDLSVRKSEYSNTFFIETELYDQSVCGSVYTCKTQRKSFALSRGILTGF